MTWPDPLLQIRTLSAVRELETTARRYSRRALLKVLTFVPDPNPLVRAFQDRLAKCQLLVTMELRELPNGASRWVEIGSDSPDRGLERKTFFRGCRHPLCPHCAYGWTWKEANRTWKKMTRIIEKPRRAHFTNLNVDIISGPLGEDYRPFRDQFKRKLTKLLDRHLPGSLLAGGFHINLTDNRLGKLHFHGWIRSSGLKHEQVAEVLSGAFPGLDELDVQGMKPGRSIAWHFKRVLRYATDHHLTVNGLKLNTPHILHDWIASTELLRGSGLKGLRMQRGLTKGRTQKLAQPSIKQVQVRMGKPARVSAAKSLPLTDHKTPAGIY